MIRKIVSLKTGQTPDNAPKDAPSLDGAWGTTSDEAIEAFQGRTGHVVRESWHRDDTLYVITQFTVDHTKATPLRFCRSGTGFLTNERYFFMMLERSKMRRVSTLLVVAGSLSAAQLGGCGGNADTPAASSGASGGSGGSPGAADGNGGSGGGGAPAVTGPKITVTGRSGTALANVDVVVHGPEGDVVARGKTEADGTLTMAVPAGGGLSIAYESTSAHKVFNSAFDQMQPVDEKTNPFYNLITSRTRVVETFYGLDDTSVVRIAVDATPTEPVARNPMWLVRVKPEPGPGAPPDGYRVFLSCRGGDFVSAIAKPADKKDPTICGKGGFVEGCFPQYSGCPGQDTYSVLTFAVDKNSAIIGQSLLANLPFTPDDVAAGAPLDTMGLHDVPNDAVIGPVSLAPLTSRVEGIQAGNALYVSVNGYMNAYDTRGIDLASGPAAKPASGGVIAQTFQVPMGVFERVVVREDLVQSPINSPIVFGTYHDRRAEGVPPSSTFTPGGIAPLAEFSQPVAAVATRPELVVRVDAKGALGDALLVDLEWPSTQTEKGRWIAHMPPTRDRTTLRFPALPTELASYGFVPSMGALNAAALHVDRAKVDGYAAAVGVLDTTPDEETATYISKSVTLQPAPLAASA